MIAPNQRQHTHNRCMSKLYPALFLPNCRWHQLREGRGSSHDHTGTLTAVIGERAEHVGPLATTARTRVLETAAELASAPVRRFLASAEKPPSTATVEAAVTAAAARLTDSQEAVISALAAGCVRRGSAMEAWAAGVTIGNSDAIEALEIAREDAVVRARACGGAVKAWWERQVETASKELSLRETELQERRY